MTGLRREELAVLAGVSVDYLVRLEQARATNPSPRVLDALARALRLSRDERATLHRMAGSAPPATEIMPREVPASVRSMVERLADTPVAVFSAGWDLLEWNALWGRLVGDPSGWTGRDRNIAWRHFCGARFAIEHSAEVMPAFERELVADLRVAAAVYPDDPGLHDVVAALSAASDTFVTLWERFDVTPRAAGRVAVAHPEVGRVALDCTVMTVVGSDQKVSVITAIPGSADARKLDGLRALVGPGRDWHCGS